jgi:hypothetical protein
VWASRLAKARRNYVQVCVLQAEAAWSSGTEVI